MIIDLSRLDSGPLSVELNSPDAAPEKHQYIKLQSADRLQGRLISQNGDLQLDAVSAHQAVMESLRLIFGTVVVGFPDNTRWTAIEANYTSTPSTTLNLHAAALQATMLKVEVGQTIVSGTSTLEKVHLRVVGGCGSIDAAGIEISAFDLQLEETQAKADTLSAGTTQIGWGDLGLSLRGQNLKLINLRVQLKQATLTIDEVQIQEFDFKEGNLHVQGVHIAGLRASADLGSSAKEDSPKSSTSTRKAAADSPQETNAPSLRWIHPELLDALDGDIHVDVGVDLAVPVIKRRRAVHPLRVALKKGYLDYRDLESDLSVLEDALLDFSLRDGALVLELGLPLLPTRGLGKALLRWPLDQSELERAHQNQEVRLAKLIQPEPRARSAADSPEPSSSSEPSVALRALTFRDVNANLSLSRRDLPFPAIIRHLSFGALHITGEAIHNPGQVDGLDGTTQVQTAFSDLAATLEPIRLGERILSVRGLNLPSSNRADLSFSELRPARVELVLANLSLNDLSTVPV